MYVRCRKVPSSALERQIMVVRFGDRQSTLGRPLMVERLRMPVCLVRILCGRAIDDEEWVIEETMCKYLAMGETFQNGLYLTLDSRQSRQRSHTRWQYKHTARPNSARGAGTTTPDCSRSEFSSQWLHCRAHLHHCCSRDRLNSPKLSVPINRPASDPQQLSYPQLRYNIKHHPGQRICV